MKKYIEDRTAALFLPISLIIRVCTGPGSSSWLALSMGIVAWALSGTVGKKDGLLWVLAGILSCLSGNAFAGEIVMMGCAVLLWQSLDAEGRRRAKLWCLRAISAAALYVMIGFFMIKTGKLDAGVQLPDLSLLFALAALSDASSKRRFLSCLALGMSGSPLGLICLGAGLLFKEQDWASDLVWTLFGLTWLVFPWPEVWLVFAAFAFWCVPETLAFLGHDTRWHFLPFLVSVWNPWALMMLGDWAVRMKDLVFGNSAFGSGFTTVWGSAGVLCALLMLAGSVLFLRKASGYVWLIGFVFGSWCPALFLLGAGTGMADVPDEERTNAGVLCRTALILALALSLMNSPFTRG